MPPDPHDFVSEPIDRARCNNVYGPRLQECIGGRLMDSQEEFWRYSEPTKGPKFVEGWDLHRRGFPITALVSIEAKVGWWRRERLYPHH